MASRKCLNVKAELRCKVCELTSSNRTYPYEYRRHLASLLREHQRLEAALPLNLSSSLFSACASSPQPLYQPFPFSLVPALLVLCASWRVLVILDQRLRLVCVCARGICFVLSLAYRLDCVRTVYWRHFPHDLVSPLLSCLAVLRGEPLVF